jgi:hypothetical protein
LSLVEILVGVGLLGVLGLAGAKLASNGLESSKSVSNRQDLVTLKETLIRRLDCYKTVGVAPPLAASLNCAAYGSVVPRDRNNSVLTTIGDWTITAGCSNNSVVLKATRPGKDPLTKRNYSAAPEASDLFRGTSSFCRELFDPSYLKYIQFDLQQLGTIMGADCPNCFSGRPAAGGAAVSVNVGCRGVVNTNFEGYTFMGNSACSRLCRGKGWASGYLAECNDMGGAVDWRTHKADCACIE